MTTSIYRPVRDEMRSCLLPSFLFKRTRGEMAFKGIDDLMDKVSASQLRDRGFEPHTGHDHDSPYATITG